MARNFSTQYVGEQKNGESYQLQHEGHLQEVTYQCFKIIVQTYFGLERIGVRIRVEG
jgi:hypothetical protein